MRLQAPSYKRRDGGYPDDGASRRRLGRHLTRGGLDAVEGAIEIRADGLGVEVRLNSVKLVESAFGSA